jgi:hypothetical protein
VSSAGSREPAGPRPVIRRVKDWVLHPFFLGALPILILWAQNLDEQVPLLDAIRVLALVLGAVALLMVLGIVLFRRPRKIAIVVSAWIALFFSFGYVWGGALGGEALAAGSPSPLAPILWGGLAVLAIVLAARMGRSIVPLTRWLNLVSAVLVVVNLFPIVTYDAGEVPQAVDAFPTEEPSPGEERRPDIYYLIFDRYGRQDTLAETFTFDNGPFLRGLSDRGFFVATRSVANYPKTSHSLAASLNMRYLDFLSGEAKGSSLAPTYELIRQSEVVDFLKGQGYRFVLVGSGWSPTSTSPMADTVWKYEAGSEFSSALFGTTILEGVGEELGPVSRQLNARTVKWHRTLFQFDRVAKSRDLPGPKFLLAHFLLPHGPYVFDREGRFVNAEEESTRDWRDLYTEQLMFTNRRINELLDHILSGPDESDPIVILQADEGPHPEELVGNPDSFLWDEASDEDLRLKFRIFNAYYLSGGRSERLYPSITPVNSFRVLLNEYFGLHMALLPDRSFTFPDYEHLYDFTDVTPRVG